MTSLPITGGPVKIHPLAGMLAVVLTALVAIPADAAPLSPAALGCQRAIGKAGQKYKKSYLKAWQKCLDDDLTGKGCDTFKRDGLIAGAQTTFLFGIAKKCNPSLLFDAPPAGIGFAQSCNLPAASVDDDEAQCQGLSVNSRDSLALCLICWKKAALNEVLKAENPCRAGSLPPGANFPCGTPPPSCPSDSAGITCERKIAKAGNTYFLAREKAFERCLDGVRAGKTAGPCPDANAQKKIAAADAKKTALVQKCGSLPPWWDTCPVDCGLPIGSLADVATCLSSNAHPAAEQVACQQYPGADADGVACPSVHPTTSTTTSTTQTTTTTTGTGTTSTSTTLTATTTTTGTTGTGGSTTTTTSMGGTTTTIVRTCTFASGSQARVQGLFLSANLAVTGHQDWHFSPAGPDGVRPILIPASGTHFDPAPLPGGLGNLCVRGNGDGTGVVDCDGGLSSYDNAVQQDHNTSNPPGGNGGFAQDPECDDTFMEPDGSISTAKLEGASDPHPGVCNSPVHITESGTFPAGGMKLTEHLIVRVVTGATPCPADTDPFDASAGDIAVSGSTTSGTSAGTIFDVNNTTGNLAQSASGCGGGPEPCTCNVVGVPFACASIDAGSLTGGKLGVAFPALDIQFVQDIVGTLAIICQ
jgi:hypothetical protein